MSSPLLWVTAKYPRGYVCDVGSLRDELSSRCGMDVRIGKRDGSGAHGDFEIILVAQPLWDESHVGLLAHTERAMVFRKLLGDDGWKQLVIESGCIEMPKVAQDGT